MDGDDNGLNIDDTLSRNQVESLTVPQIKQQLRLRGLKVSGKKQELIDRLVTFSLLLVEELKNSDEAQHDDTIVEPEILSQEEMSNDKGKALRFAQDEGKELIDVTDFLEDNQKGKNVNTANINGDDDDVPDPEEANLESSSSGPEVWGSDAKIVDDYEGRSPIVDSMSRTVVEYKGSNQTMVQAYVVASRDALRPFLAGGKNRTGDVENQMREIQTKREQAAKRPVRFEEDEGLDEGDENGLYANILDRDYSDWGKYTLTGAQLSAEEVQGVLLLTDVYGTFTEDTKVLVEKIAFECQPVVVMVPDLFRGDPWKEVPSTPGVDAKGRDYEEWRATHSDHRVNIDIRAAGAVLREQYGVSSVTVWGTCYGGGRALEVAAGYLPDGKILDIDGTVGPVPVDPEVVVAWYPTRYIAKELFGTGKGEKNKINGDKRSMAVMAVFAGNDKLPGATAEDAKELKSLLGADERVKDLMVKVFPGQEHGFAHFGLGNQGNDENEFERFVDNEFGGSGRVAMDDGDAEVACLLSTAFMETYARVFLPTMGPAIREDETAEEWSNTLEMKNLDVANSRDVRQEIEDSQDNFVEEPLGGKRMDPTDDSQRTELIGLLRSMESDDVDPEYKIEDDDDLEIMYAKLKAADDTFQIF
jgi:dienelactone hydrolase